LLQKQLHIFFSLVLQANDSVLIPPYLKSDRDSAGVKDISMKYQVSDIKGFSQVKRYFSRLFPRPEGGQYYLNIIIALTKGVGWVTENIKCFSRITRWVCRKDLPIVNKSPKCASYYIQPDCKTQKEFLICFPRLLME
jgi:hypothetical protein